tara:strand:+ start:140 stop:601 length:462 start_codon:yes stop_codon:yes gene_type:complete
MKNFRDIAKKFLEGIKSETDKYTSVKAKIVENGSESLSIFTAGHLFFAKNGRKAGKAPPLDAMLDFVKSKNILFDGLDSRGTAFAIQQSIKSKGTKNYKPNGTDPLTDAVKKYQRKYEKDLNDFIVVDMNERLNKEMKQHFDNQKKTLGNFKL